MAAGRYPFAPLEAAVRPQNLNLVLMVNATVLARFRSDGLSAVQADRLACRIGKHPSELWPDWADSVPDPACEWCGRHRITVHNATKCGRGIPCSTYDTTRLKCWWKRLDRYRESLGMVA